MTELRYTSKASKFCQGIYRNLVWVSVSSAKEMPKIPTSEEYSGHWQNITVKNSLQHFSKNLSKLKKTRTT